MSYNNYGVSTNFLGIENVRPVMSGLWSGRSLLSELDILAVGRWVTSAILTTTLMTASSRNRLSLRYHLSQHRYLSLALGR
ncbi:hypothetical protein Gbem_3003 [Citrifermentans bemidjiense Bem]|uniref:Uncharacterized protein n=1 Tax=Citrifermentans bemidjiense (strain ATCC BAA-1014 / DSM 16622 / JCM 12645 / Bem) TaxID=404380 RepID=B5E837_CITBB|nr:hypothetical protein [Citrifermentans bemidjiense]ACH40006.1 hypothetical protein Gbem_3003 [Citrifermentans bemidjiense Bem]